MAKMFYTLEEVKQALGVNEEQIKLLTREGKVREFRDGPRVMFKADQVDQLRHELEGAWRFATSPPQGAPVSLDQVIAQDRRSKSRAPLRGEGGIFINYRREDSDTWVDHIYEKLCSHFSKNHVFMDVDSIPPGVDFVDAITSAASKCGLMLVIMGRGWAKMADNQGRPRIQNDDDFVRLEIAAAIRLNIPILPVLGFGASMPSQNELPEEIRALARRNACTIVRATYADDLDALVRHVERLMRM